MKIDILIVLLLLALSSDYIMASQQKSPLYLSPSALKEISSSPTKKMSQQQPQKENATKEHQRFELRPIATPKEKSLRQQKLEIQQADQRAKELIREEEKEEKEEKKKALKQEKTRQKKILKQERRLAFKREREELALQRKEENLVRQQKQIEPEANNFLELAASLSDQQLLTSESATSLQQNNETQVNHEQSAQEQHNTVFKVEDIIVGEKTEKGTIRIMIPYSLEDQTTGQKQFVIFEIFAKESSKGYKIGSQKVYDKENPRIPFRLPENIREELLWDMKNSLNHTLELLRLQETQEKEKKGQQKAHSSLTVSSNKEEIQKPLTFHPQATLEHTGDILPVLQQSATPKLIAHGYVQDQKAPTYAKNLQRYKSYLIDPFNSFLTNQNKEHQEKALQYHREYQSLINNITNDPRIESSTKQIMLKNERFEFDKHMTNQKNKFDLTINRQRTMADAALNKVYRQFMSEKEIYTLLDRTFYNIKNYSPYLFTPPLSQLEPRQQCALTPRSQQQNINLVHLFNPNLDLCRSEGKEENNALQEALIKSDLAAIQNANRMIMYKQAEKAKQEQAEIAKTVAAIVATNIRKKEDKKFADHLRFVGLDHDEQETQEQSSSNLRSLRNRYESSGLLSRG